jgi:hypothetical protein
MKGKAAASGEYCGCTEDQSPSIESRRYSTESRYLVNNERWNTRKKVLQSVSCKTGLRWAHEIIALHEAGMYENEHGYKMACEALKVDPSQVESSW